MSEWLNECICSQDDRPKVSKAEAEAYGKEQKAQLDVVRGQRDEAEARLAAAEKRLLLAMEHCPANSGDGYTGCKSLARIAALEKALAHASKAAGRDEAERQRLEADCKRTAAAFDERAEMCGKLEAENAGWRERERSLEMMLEDARLRLAARTRGGKTAKKPVPGCSCELCMFLRGGKTR